MICLIDRDRVRSGTEIEGYNRRLRKMGRLESNAMSKPLLLGTCLAVALTGACLAAQLAPCTIQPSEADKTKATEAKAAAVRAGAQRDSTAANQEAARRSSCLTDTGPRLPVSSAQCATYGATSATR